MSEYVKVPEIYKKLKQAESENRVLFISAPTGFGKNAAFNYYYRRKPHLILSGQSGRLEKMPAPSSIRQGVILFDDVCFLTDEASKQYVIDMICHGQKTVVLMGRGALPVWLVQTDMEKEFIRADKRDLIFTAKESLEYFEKNGLSTTMEMAELITERIKGYPLFLMFYTKNLNGKVEYSEDVYARAIREIYHCYDHVLWPFWNDTLQKALLATCEFDTFTVELIERITGLPKLAELIEYTYSIADFVSYRGRYVYEINRTIREYAKWKRSFVYTQDDFLNMYRTAAEYYEEIDEIELALKYYSKAQMYDKMADILIKNAEYDAARAGLFKTRHYIFSLPEELVKSRPALMGSISLVYSVMMCPEESEKWYEILKEYEQDPSRTEDEYIEARSRRSFLDISLMHRKSEDRIRGVFETAALSKNTELRLPELAFTGNSPSLLNGGVDFSKWFITDKRHVVMLRTAMKKLFGKFGDSLMTVAIAEGLFEQNKSDPFDIMSRLNSGYMMADAIGRIEICFVAAVLMARQHLIRGQIGIAVEQINSFRQKAEKENAKFLMSNLDAFQMWLALLQGDTNLAAEWLKSAPDENVEFYITDRFCYMQKVRVLLALGRLEEAYSLMQRMNVYFVEYHREYFWIQNQLLLAVLFYRMGDKRWESILVGALIRAEKCHYVRLIADGGAAVAPLLKKMKRRKEISAEFFKEILDETDKMTKMYPDYLSLENKLLEPLTKKEKDILKMLHAGKTTEEICEICNISYSGLKFHNRNIYRKLGVSNRQQAERKAVLLRIVD